MLSVVLITILAVLGAVIGALASDRTRFGQLVPFSSGLLIGMAVFLILPEALSGNAPLATLGWCAVGGLIFGTVEAVLHSIHPALHSKGIGLLPLILAVALHSLLDGWNIAVAIALTDQRVVWAFLGGMALHKATGGVAIGAIFRAGTKNRNLALACAAGCESLTAVGALLQFAFRRSMGEQWTVWLLALTSGSFLYLGYHALQTERQHRGFRRTLPGASLGLVTIWLVSLLQK